MHLRGRVVREQKSSLSPEALAMKAVAAVFASQSRYERAQRLARLGRGPLAKRRRCRAGRAMRELPEPPKQTFRDWWRDAARAEVLGRVRAALGPGVAVPEVPRGYRGRADR